ncbi:TIGR03086 family metal-binding protein [Ilumatobacter sp.]|uniref:TIGR03086 family metal-binding protein n=1 Tax=Ilumatobacter sp. TaxID=1967498 RepID=UPI003C5A10D5
MTERLDPLDALDLAQASGRAVISGLRPDDWQRPTPCDEWSVRDIVNKMVASTLMFAAFGRREPLDPPYDLVHPAEVLGDDPSDTFTRAASECSDAWRRAGALDGTAPSTVGQFPAKAVLNARIFDTTILTWDIARATGQPHGIGEPLAAYVLRVAEALVPNVRNVSPERYKDAPDVDTNATTVERMIAATGRDAAWTAP